MQSRFDWVRKIIDRPGLWHKNRVSIARAVPIGIFIAWQPFPGHMIVAAIACAIVSAYIPLSIALVWLSNPFTWPFHYGLALVTGEKLLGLPLSPLNMHHVMASLGQDYVALWCGSLLWGTITAVPAYLMVRLWQRYNRNSQP